MHELELYHHGILGQKWGIRRFQNKDGTRTAAGKERYRKDVEADVRSSISTNSDRISSIKRKNDDIDRLMVEIQREYDNALLKVPTDEAGRKVISKILRDDFGIGPDDDELFPLLLDDYVIDYIDKSMPESLVNKHSELDTTFKEYFGEIKTFIDDTLDSFPDVPISDAQGVTEKLVAKHELNSVLENDLDVPWNMRAYKHFDEWLDGSDAYYETSNRVASAFIEEYNKLYGG